MTALPSPDRIAPLKAVPVDENTADNWIVAYQTGNSGIDGKDWAIVTDNVQASALAYRYDLPGDAGDDAKAIVAILMAYREGRLVPAPLPLFPDAT